MGTINERKDKNGNIRFQAIIRVKGHPTQTETFSSITKAKRWTQQEEAAIREGRQFRLTEAKKHTLAEMIDRYIKKFHPPSYKHAQLLWWKNHLGHCLLSDITPAMVAEGRDELFNCAGKNPLIYYAQGDSHQKIMLKETKPNIFSQLYDANGIHYNSAFVFSRKFELDLPVGF